MLDIIQTNLRQTGVAQTRMKDGSVVNVPLFSEDIVEEAQNITKQLINSDKVLYVFQFDTLSSTFNQKLKESKELNKDLMDELRAGFSGNSYGYPSTISCYD